MFLILVGHISIHSATWASIQIIICSPSSSSVAHCRTHYVTQLSFSHAHCLCSDYFISYPNFRKSPYWCFCLQAFPTPMCPFYHRVQWNFVCMAVSSSRQQSLEDQEDASLFIMYSRAWFPPYSRCSENVCCLLDPSVRADGEQEGKCQKIRAFMPNYINFMKIFVINEG